MERKDPFPQNRERKEKMSKALVLNPGYTSEPYGKQKQTKPMSDSSPEVGLKYTTAQL